MALAKKTSKSVVAQRFQEASLRRAVRRELSAVGFRRNPNGGLLLPACTKEAFRNLHAAKRADVLRQERDFVLARWGHYRRYFADGNQVKVERISPSLELVEPGTWQSGLFRIASLTWSVPVSAGYGRRLRFLVWDQSNARLIGLIGLADPVFNLRVRDEYINWTAADKKHRLVNLMDAYVLGALPPYTMLLGGKLVAALVRSREIVDAFSRKYGVCQSTIMKKERPAHLVAFTTTSALGRSSVYNRLKLGGINYLRPLGYTEGWGHFHFSEKLFARLRNYLRSSGDRYSDNHRFGDGPNWRLRAIRQALTKIGVNPNLLRHGVSREVFFSELASNAMQVLRGKHKRPKYETLLGGEDIGALAKERWLLPRASRDQSYQAWSADSLLERMQFGGRSEHGLGGKEEADGISEFRS